MKLTMTDSINGSEPKTQTGKTLRNTCAACYQKVVAQITAAREAIFAESQQTLAAHDRLVRLALNEAEALAWQTTYPHLVFPTLAQEKIQALTTWNITQQSVRRSSAIFAFAA